MLAVFNGDANAVAVCACQPRLLQVTFGSLAPSGSLSAVPAWWPTLSGQPWPTSLSRQSPTLPRAPASYWALGITSGGGRTRTEVRKQSPGLNINAEGCIALAGW